MSIISLSRFLLVVSIPITSLLVACSSFDGLKDLVNKDGSEIDVPDIGTVAGTDNVLKFVVLGDAGTGNRGQYRVAEAVKKHCDNKGCDFVLMLGDNIYQTGADSLDDTQFQTKFEIPYQHIDLPFHMVLGNHDYGSGGAGLEVQKGKYQIAYTNKSTKWKMPYHYYRYTINQTLFIGLDTQAQLLGVDEHQRDKVSRWISDSNAQWKIAYGHHPYLSNGRHGNAGNYDGARDVALVNGQKIKEFSEDIWCGKVDLYLSGHDHSRQWLQPTCSGTQLLVSGAGATVTGLPGNNLVKFQKNSLGFIYIVIQSNRLKADFIDVNGVVEFSDTISK